MNDEYTDEYEGYGLGDFLRRMADKTSRTIKNVVKPVVDGFMGLAPASLRRFINWRNGYNNKSENTLQQFGRFRIKQIFIRRCPVNSILVNIMNTLTFGYFKELMSKYGYDQLFHLQLIVVLENRMSITIEKNEEIDIYNKANFSNTNGCDSLEVRIPVDFALTLKQFIDYAKRQVTPEKWFDYDAFKNNCQIFILMLLAYNGIRSKEIQDFVYQPMDELFEDLQSGSSYLAPFAKAVTRTGAIFNKIIGKGIFENEVGSKELYKVIKLLVFSINNASILGSYSDPQIHYPSDIDIFEMVGHNSNILSQKFQQKIKKIMSHANLFITDIKIGTLPELKVIDESMYFSKTGRLLRYRPQESRKRLKQLLDDQFISQAEYDSGIKLLVDNPDHVQAELIKDNLRFHVLRWTPQEVMSGKKTVRGIEITLEDALSNPGLFKMDILAFNNEKYQEISIIYNMDHHVNVHPKRSIKSDSLRMLQLNKHLKAVKRMLALLKYEELYEGKDHNKKILEMTTFLNKDIGELSQISNDLTVLLDLPNKTKYVNNITVVLSQIIQRLKQTGDKEFSEGIIHILKNENSKDKLKKVITKIDNNLNNKARQFLKEKNII